MRTTIAILISIIFATAAIAQEKTSDKMQWETKVMNRISDTSQLKNAEDAMNFERYILIPFLHNLGRLGAEKEIESNYSMEQYKKMLVDIKAIEKIFSSLEKKFDFEQTGGTYENIQHLLNVLEMRTDYSGFHEYKRRNGLEEKY